MPCLVCGREGKLDWHHFPHAVGMGRNRKQLKDMGTVPLCRPCHSSSHWGTPAVIETLIARAPDYWRSVGEWELHCDEYETWLAKRRYREAVG